MIIDTANKQLSTNVPSNGANYTIKASAQAFQILSSAIYEHKIAAVVRELCTNAFDSHSQAGVGDKPFSVVLPTKMHPYFEIEDFGVGMNATDAVDVYTVYFSSTKNDSNEVAGGLGLGSKTPFAYTKQFTVRLRKDGVENTAMIYMDASGCPRMDIISTTSTNEPNGVKVTVPVEEKDFHVFATEASFYLSFYPVTPDINTDLALMYPDAGVRLADADQAHAEKRTHGNSSLSRGSFYAVMGPVPYAIDIMGMITDKTVREILNLGIRESGSLFVRFDIGELAVAASRESLSLDESTTQVVIDRFSKSASNIRDRMMTLAKGEAGQHPLDVYDGFMKEFPHDMFVNFVKAGSGFEKIFQSVAIPKIRTLDYEGWGRSRRLAFKKPNLTMRNVRDKIQYHGGKIRILTIDTDKNFIKPVYDGVSYNFLYDGTMSELRRKRIEKIFNAEVELISYAELYTEYLAERRRNRAVIRGLRNTYAKGNIPATYVLARRPNSTRLTTSAVTVTKARVNVDENTIYVEGDRGEYMLGENYVSMDDLHVIAMMILHHDPSYQCVKIVVKNSQNKLRIEKFEVPSISDVFKKVVEENLDDMYDACVAYIAQTQSFNAFANLLVEAKSARISKEIIRKIAKVRELAAKPIYEFEIDTVDFINNLDGLRELLQTFREEYVKPIRNFNGQMSNFMAEHYPMMYYTQCYTNIMEGKMKEHVIGYVQQIDKADKKASQLAVETEEKVDTEDANVVIEDDPENPF